MSGGRQVPVGVDGVQTSPILSKTAFYPRPAGSIQGARDKGGEGRGGGEHLVLTIPGCVCWKMSPSFASSVSLKICLK